MKPGKVNYLIRWDDVEDNDSNAEQIEAENVDAEAEVDNKNVHTARIPEFIQFQALCDIREEEMPPPQQEKQGTTKRK